jgi:hypothetical protein
LNCASLIAAAVNPRCALSISMPCIEASRASYRR